MLPVYAPALVQAFVFGARYLYPAAAARLVDAHLCMFRASCLSNLAVLCCHLSWRVRPFATELIGLACEFLGVKEHAPGGDAAAIASGVTGVGGLVDGLVGGLVGGAGGGAGGDVVMLGSPLIVELSDDGDGEGGLPVPVPVPEPVPEEELKEVHRAATVLLSGIVKGSCHNEDGGGAGRASRPHWR